RPRKPKVEPPSPSKVKVPVERAIEHCRVFVDGEALPGEFTPRSALDAVAEYKRGLVWVGLVEPVEHQMTSIAEQFGIPELIVEDAVVAHQWPKLERYDDQLFVVARSVNYRDSDEVKDRRDVISTGEVQVIMGKNFLITVCHTARLTNLGYTCADEQAVVEIVPVAMVWKSVDRRAE